jgi:hypothetical protein
LIIADFFLFEAVHLMLTLYRTADDLPDLDEVRAVTMCLVDASIKGAVK